MSQVKSDGYNVSAAVNGAFAAGKEIDTQFGTQVTGDFRRFSEYSGQ